MDKEEYVYTVYNCTEGKIEGIYTTKEKAIENVEKDEEKIINECIVIYKIPFNQECIFDLGYEYSVVYPQKEQKNKIELKN